MVAVDDELWPGLLAKATDLPGDRLVALSPNVGAADSSWSWPGSGQSWKGTSTCLAGLRDPHKPIAIEDLEEASSFQHEQLARLK